ncbi:MAG: hypothetical protein E7583_10625 [Ruminococcaceae bacterium]|nr:hypothetical protein [Oscillospiraceae bacterium]
MKNEIFWTALGAIGTVFGSVATFLAVVVALWQTKYPNKKSVKMSCCDAMTYITNAMTESYDKTQKNKYISIEFANTGNRKIIIKYCYIQLPKGEKYVLIPSITPIERVEYPIEVDIENSVSIPWLKSDFLNYLESNKKLKRNRRICFCILDSSGKVYKCKSPKKVNQYLKDIKRR